VALTGEKLNGADMIALGLATHYSMSEHLDLVDERLAKLVTDDPSVIDSSLAQYGDMVYPDKKSIVHRLDVIDKCFSHETVEEIVDALESEAARLDEEWCTLALKRLKEASPLALKVSLRSIREGRYQTLDECLVREYRMSMHGISKQFSHEFCEGVRARLVEKDLAPKVCFAPHHWFFQLQIKQKWFFVICALIICCCSGIPLPSSMSQRTWWMPTLHLLASLMLS
jgi:3-hydroxyisobutyryl-CoA hydrolase